jgi:hypothetical protein
MRPCAPERPKPRIMSVEKLGRCVNRGVSLEVRGTESNSFNTVFGAWLGARVFLRRTLHKLSLQAAPSHRSIA